MILLKKCCREGYAVGAASAVVCLRYHVHHASPPLLRTLILTLALIQAPTPTLTTGAITMHVPGGELTFGLPSATKSGKSNGESMLAKLLGLVDFERRFKARLILTWYLCTYYTILIENGMVTPLAYRL